MGTCAHLQNWMHSKLKNILLHNWTTFYGIVSISTTCWRKFVQFRFAKFCSILKSIRGDGSLGLGNLFTSANVGICRENLTNIGLYITPKQPFEISNSRNDIKKSPSALHLEKYTKVPNFVKKETNKEMQSSEIARNF